MTEEQNIYNNKIIEEYKKIINETKKNKNKEYMKEWKKNQYKINGEFMREKNKAYYYKYKYNISSEELQKYDLLLPSIVRLKKEIEDLKNKNPIFLLEILDSYYTELKQCKA
jgi:hypothetical protein